MPPSNPLNVRHKDSVSTIAVKKTAHHKSSIDCVFGAVRNIIGYLPQRECSRLQNSEGKSSGNFPETEKLADSGYQGIAKRYANSSTPIKAYRSTPLSQEAKQFNRRLATQRVVIEHIVRQCKIFRITKDVYQVKHRNYGKTWNVIAAIVNLRHSSTSCQTV